MAAFNQPTPPLGAPPASTTASTTPPPAASTAGVSVLSHHAQPFVPGASSHPSSLFTILSLNTAHMASMAGLPALLHETSPNLVFLQEISPNAQLLALATSKGYSCHFSTSRQPPKRTLAILANVPVVVSDGRPGYLQEVKVGGMVFINIHAPSGASERREREAMFGRLVARCRQLDKPVLVGDFNCVLHPLDVEANFLAKSSPALLRLVNDLCYVDAYRVLHPATRQFSFYRRGGTASRLDKVLLPPPPGVRPKGGPLCGHPWGSSCFCFEVGGRKPWPAASSPKGGQGQLLLEAECGGPGRARFYGRFGVGMGALGRC